jgi:hypothetical protein
MPETLRPAENGEFNGEAGLGTSYRVKLVENSLAASALAQASPRHCEEQRLSYRHCEER